MKLETKVKKLGLKYHNIAKQIKSLEKEKTKLKDEILESFAILSIKKLEFDDITISWCLIDSTRFDSKTFKEKYQDLYNQFIIPYSYTTISTRL